MNLTSWMGKSGVAHHGAYCASKFAIVALTQALASEVGEHGVRVNAAAPGLIVGTKMREEAEIDRRAKGLETPVSGSSSARTDGGAVRRELPYALKVPPSSPCFTSSVALARQAGGPPWPPAPCK